MRWARVLLMMTVLMMPPAVADIEFGVSETGVQRLFERALPTTVNPNIKVSTIPDLQFVRLGHSFVITNLRETNPEYPRLPDVENPAKEPDLQVRILGDQVTAKIAPTEIKIQSNHPVEFKIPGSKHIEIPTEDGKPSGMSIDLENVKFTAKSLAFESHGGMDFTTVLKLSSTNGLLAIHQEKANIKIDSKSYNLSFGDLDVDIEIPSNQAGQKVKIDRNSAAYLALMQQARRYVAEKKESFTQNVFAPSLSSFIEEQIKSALENKVNPSLQGLDRVTILKKDAAHDLADVKYALSFIPSSPTNSVLFGVLSPARCERSSPEKRLQMGTNDVVVAFDGDGLNEVIKREKEVVLDPTTGAKVILKEAPRARIENGRVFVSLFGEYQPGSSEDETAVQRVVGLNRLEGRLVAEVKPIVQDGKFQLLLQDIQGVDMRVYQSTANPKDEGVRIRYQKLPNGNAQVIVGQKSFEEAIKSLSSNGALGQILRFRKSPKITLSNGEMNADLNVSINKDQIPPLAKAVDELVVGDDGKPLKKVDATVDAKLKARVVTEGRKRVLQLDLVDVTQLSTPITSTDTWNVKGFKATVLSHIWFTDFLVRDGLKVSKKNLKHTVIGALQDAVRNTPKTQANQTNSISGLTFSVPISESGISKHKTISRKPADMSDQGFIKTVPYDQLGQVNAIPGHAFTVTPPGPALIRMSIDTQDKNFKKYFSVPFNELGNQYELENIKFEGSDATLTWKTEKLKENRKPLFTKPVDELYRDSVNPNYSEQYQRVVGDKTDAPPPLEINSVTVIGDQIQLGATMK